MASVASLSHPLSSFATKCGILFDRETELHFQETFHYARAKLHILSVIMLCTNAVLGPWTHLLLFGYEETSLPVCAALITTLACLVAFTRVMSVRVAMATVDQIFAWHASVSILAAEDSNRHGLNWTPFLLCGIYQSSMHASFYQSVPFLSVFLLRLLQLRAYSYCFALSAGICMFYLYEKTARLLYQSARDAATIQLMSVEHRTESDVTHLLGNFLHQILCATNNARIHQLVRQAQVWMRMKGSLFSIRAGTFKQAPTSISMEAYFSDIGFQPYGVMDVPVRIDEVLFTLCIEQARSNVVRYGLGPPLVSQNLEGRMLVTHITSTDASDTIPVRLGHSFFEEGVTTRGTGLGLDTVKACTDIVGGWCSLVGSEGRTTLTVALPATVAESLPKTSCPLTRVAVVDDDAFVAELLVATLPKTFPGAAVGVFAVAENERTSAEAAAKLVVRFDPDLIVCDNNIAAISGLDVGAHIRALGCGAVMVLHTACTEDERRTLMRTQEHVFDGVHVKGEAFAMLGELYATCAATVPYDDHAAFWRQLDEHLLHTRVADVAHRVQGLCAYVPAARRVMDLAIACKRDCTAHRDAAMRKAILQLRRFSHAP